MQFELDVRRVGCGTKLTYERLLEVRRTSGLGAFEDAELFELNGTKTANTIDTIGRFCASEDAFIRTAVQHCLNDLYAVDADPSILSASITYGPEYEMFDAGMGNFVRCLLDATSELGVRLGNLHSLTGEYTSLTLSAVGLVSTEGVPSKNGKLFLSGPIGNFKMGILQECEGESGDRWFAAARLNAVRSRPSGIGVMSDVTGFGLAGTLLSLANKYSLECNVQLSGRMVVDSDVYSMPFGCLTEQYDKIPNIRLLNDRARQIASCRELCGPSRLPSFFWDSDLPEFPMMSVG